ncbi:unnamed protein product [Paramecium sonneborni]|uniref:Uncharacterized protein n=1 Tax=Paramecium sonneborni TaxID=65129 RepID=A0A8S1KNF8_9CILI|nr:unnamed protein product [Paramecium sonneborni]
MAALSTLRFIGKFIFSHSNYKDPKYGQLLHPLLCFLISSFSYMYGSIRLENKSLDRIEDFQESQTTRNIIAIGFIFYVMLIIFARFGQAKFTIFYELMWACNLSLFSSAYAFWKNKPLILAASMILVSIDQVLWYVDLLAFFLFKTWPIGVAKYLTWPSTTKLRLLTSFHHIFYLPICLYFLRNQKGIPITAWQISIGMGSILTIVSRLLTPKSILLKGQKEEIYLNLNLSRQLWKDIPFKILTIADDKPWYIALPFSSLMWNSGNYILGYELLNRILKYLNQSQIQ